MILTTLNQPYSMQSVHFGGIMFLFIDSDIEYTHIKSNYNFKWLRDLKKPQPEHYKNSNKYKHRLQAIFEVKTKTC